MRDQFLGLVRETLEQFGYASQEEEAAFSQGEMAWMKFSHSKVCVCMTFTEKFRRNVHWTSLHLFFSSHEFELINFQVS